MKQSEKLWTTDEVMALVSEIEEIALDELEDAALKAAKEAVVETGSELAYEKKLREQWENEAEKLTIKLDEEEERTAFWKKMTLGTAVSLVIAITILIIL